MNQKIRVAISHGDINGIGYEILLKTFADDRLLELFTPIIYGSSRAVAYWQNALGLEPVRWNMIKVIEDARDGQINLIDCTDGDVHVEIGKPTVEAGRWAFLALERAVDDALKGAVDLIVTAPINKSVMPRDTFPYNGHTQYLESRAAVVPERSLMLLCAQDCRVALATGHIAVSEISDRLSPELIVNKVKILEAGLKRDFGIGKPRIAIFGLNPHAGDRGLMGDEEARIITPAIDQLQSEGSIVFGPYAADGFWSGGQADSFDGILAMYHDQGLAPFKAMYMSEGVNTTLGLHIVRTSPDHGTGYDIAGKGIAQPDSLRQAIYLGLDIVRARRAWDYANRNPLRRTYYNKGKDDEKIDFMSSIDEY